MMYRLFFAHFICTMPQMAVDGLQRMESDMDRVIEKDEGADRTRSSRTEPMDLRTRLDHLIHSHKFMVGIGCYEVAYNWTS